MIQVTLVTIVILVTLVLVVLQLTVVILVTKQVNEVTGKAIPPDYWYLTWFFKIQPTAPPPKKKEDTYSLTIHLYICLSIYYYECKFRSRLVITYLTNLPPAHWQGPQLPYGHPAAAHTLKYMDTYKFIYILRPSAPWWPSCSYTHSEIYRYI